MDPQAIRIFGSDSAQTELMPAPRISVAMATYNGGRHIADQLRSLAEQSNLPFDLQVGDDGSQDDTLAIVHEFAKTAPFPVVIHENSTKLGYGQNFLETAKRCSGDWIAFCDQDDIWHPAKLATCSSWIDRGPEDLHLIVHDAYVLGEDAAGSDVRLYKYSSVIMHPPLSLPPTWFHHGFTTVFRSDLVHSIAIRPRIETPRLPGTIDERFPHDVWIALLANVLGTILILPDALAGYRRHGFAVTPIRINQPLLNRFRGMIRNNVDTYRYLSAWSERGAQIFSAAAEVETNAVRAVRFDSGARAMRQYSAVMKARSCIHGDGALKARLHCLWGLLTSGGYTTARWPLGSKALFKDVVMLARKGHA